MFGMSNLETKCGFGMYHLPQGSLNHPPPSCSDTSHMEQIEPNKGAKESYKTQIPTVFNSQCDLWYSA